MGDLFRALADPTRRLILDGLAERDAQTLFEICARLATQGVESSRQAISQHLDVLEAADLIDTRRDGRWKLHTLNAAPLETMLDRWRRPPTATPIPEADDANPPDEHPGR